MSKIHFKFKSSKEYDSITFDGIQLSLDDVRKYIYNKRNLSSTEFNLQIVNAQNNEEYTDGSEMILKNTSVIVSRIPVGGIATESLVTPKEKEATKEEPVAPDITLDKLKKTKGDLPMAIGMMEEEKLKDAIQKSTSMYDPTTFRTKYGKPVPIGDPGKSYICNKCGKSGHWIQNCPEKEAIPKSEYRLGAGIPLQHLKLVADPNAPGAVLTREGYFGVTVVDAEAYENQKKKQQVPRLPEPEEPVPEQLCCSICKELAKGAITTPCCKEMTCDKCFCDALITDERTCPLCKKKNVSPAGIEANKYIRREVMLFRSGQPRPSTDVKRVMGTDSASASPRSDTGSAQASPLYEEPSREEPAKLSTTDTTAVSTAAPVSVPDVIVPVVATVAESSSSTSQTSISASSSAPSLIAPTRPLLGTAPPNVAPSASTFSLTAPTLPFNNYGQATYTAPVPMMPPVVHRPPPQPLYDPSSEQRATFCVCSTSIPEHFCLNKQLTCIKVFCLS